MPEMAHSVIPLAEHPNSADDASSVLVTGPIYRGRDVFRHRAGFLACLPDGMALAGLFATLADAIAAQDAVLASPENA